MLEGLHGMLLAYGGNDTAAGQSHNSGHVPSAMGMGRRIYLCRMHKKGPAGCAELSEIQRCGLMWIDLRAYMTWHRTVIIADGAEKLNII